MNIRNTLLPLITLAALLLTSPVFSKQIQLDVDLATPVIKAEQKQKAFIKVSLTGYEQLSVEQRIPANIALVLDKSGSMSGEKMAYAKQAATLAVERLNSEDILSIITYDTGVEVVVPATKLTNKAQVIKAIQQIQPNGSTALFAGVSQGAAEIRKFMDKNKVNRVILMSDGLANVGPQSPSELGQLGMALGREGMSVTTIGLGLGYNEDLMTQLAGYSDGNHAFVENAADLATIFQYEFGDVLSVIAQDVDIEIQCKNGVKPIRVLGRQADILGNRVHTSLSQLYSEQEKYLLLEVEVPAQQSTQALQVADVTVNYHNLHAKKRDQLTEVALVRFSSSDSEVRSAINTPVYEAAVQQVANEASKKAIDLRDKGDVKQAQDVLSKNASYLRQEAAALGGSQALEEQASESIEDAEKLESTNWNRTRKELKAKQYKVEKQQSY
jgi:Ca-activated chloride channel family protein